MRRYRTQTLRIGGLDIPRIAIGVAVLAMVAALWVTLVTPVGAQDEGGGRHYGHCDAYGSQENAQAALNSTSDPIVMDILDHNDDGIACDNFDFAAGQYIDDGDAVMVVVCDESNGILVEVEEWIADGSLHFPSHRATDAEIAAGACAVTAPREPADVMVCGEATGEVFGVSQEAIDLGSLDFAYQLATDAEIAAGACEITVPAESQADTTGLGIRKYLCPSAEAFESGSADCELGPGVTFEVATEDGVVLGSCTTEISVIQTSEVATCYVLEVPYDTLLIIIEDTSTGPAGYVPLLNPQWMTIERPAPDAQDYTPTAVFVNIPAETGGDSDPTDGEDTEATTGEETGATTKVVTLPNTGAGIAAEGGHVNVLFGTAMLLLSGMSLMVRRTLVR